MADVLNWSAPSNSNAFAAMLKRLETEKKKKEIMAHFATFKINA